MSMSSDHAYIFVAHQSSFLRLYNAKTNLNQFINEINNKVNPNINLKTFKKLEKSIKNNN